TIPQVLAQLQTKDKEAANKLMTKVTSKLESANMLSSPEAGNLALMLLQGGPRPDNPESSSDSNGAQPTPTPQTQPTQQTQAAQQSANRLTAPVLTQSAYTDIMNMVIDAALRTVPQQATNGQRGGAGPRSRNFAPQTNNQSTPTDGQIEQNN